MRVAIASVYLTMLGSACGGFLHPAAESFVSLRGNVADVPAGAACHLDLFTTKNERAAQLTVDANFNRSAVIAPGSHEYYVHIACDGVPGSFKSNTYTLGGGRRELDLGRIVLR